MTNKHSLSVTIGAALSNGFKNAFQGGKTALTEMGGSIKKLEATSRKIEAFKKLKQDAQKNINVWKASREELQKLQTKMDATKEPSRKLRQEFSKMQTLTRKSERAYLKNKEALFRTRSELRSAGVDMGKLRSEQNRLGGSVDKLRGKYDSLNKSINRRERNDQIRSQARSKIIGAAVVGASLAAPIRASINFESVMADVKKKLILPDDKKEAKRLVSELQDTLILMSREIPVSPTGLAEIASAGASKGLESKKIPNFVDIVAKMSTAFEIPADEIGMSMTKVSNALIIPFEELREVGDAINHLTDNMSAEPAEVIEVLKRAGGTGKGFGLNTKQITGLATSFIALGKTPQIAGSAMNAMLRELQNAEKGGENFRSSLAEIGFSVEELKDAIANDAQGALISFLEAANALDSRERLGILTDIFGKNFSDDVSLLASSIGTYKKALSLVEGSESAKLSGSMEREFASRRDTRANELQLIGNTITEMGINAGDPILESLSSIFNGIRKITEVIADLVKAAPGVSKAVFTVAFGLLALKIASIGAAYAWAGMSDAGGMLIKTLKGVWKAILWTEVKLKLLNIRAIATSVIFRTLAIGGTIKAFGAMLLGLAGRVIPLVITGFRALTVAIMTNPIGLIIGGIALAAGLIITNWEKVKSFFITIWDHIKPIWENFFGWIKNAIGLVLSPLKAIGKVWSWLFGKDKSVNVTTKAEQQGTVLKDAAKDLVRSQRNTDNRTINQQVKINLQTRPGQDSKQIAEDVMREIKAQSRGAMFDVAGATL